MASRLRLPIAALALAFLGAHVQSLPRSLGDIDTINFALGVESFDVVAHRPHPPGYPVFVALARVSTAVVRSIAPDWDRTAQAAVGLEVWGILGGTLLAWILVGFWTTLRLTPLAAWFAAAVAIGSPLFWFTAGRPLTDAAGLVTAVAVQWMLVRVLTHMRAGREAPGWIPVAAAFCAGLAVGLRTQTMWLTGPLLAWVAVERIVRHRGWGAAAAMTGAAAAGALLWFVPLVADAGGLDAYLDALLFQGGDDFNAVPMLATSPGLAQLLARLGPTFIDPWHVSWLGYPMAAAALTGAVSLLRRDRWSLAVLAAGFLPYVVFHLLFQDVDTIRYALPVVVPMAGLAIVAMSALPPRVFVVCASAIASASLVVGHDALSRFSADVPPTFRAFRDARDRARTTGDRPLVVVHDGMRRVADWFRPEWPEVPVFEPHERVWLRVVDHFRSGRTDRAWFLADSRRSDIALFDPRGRVVTADYLRDPGLRRLVGHTRQDEVRWWEIDEPRWMAGQGWALSPDATAASFAAGREPHQVPADVFLRRAREPHRLLIGGSYWGGTGDGVLVVQIDGRPVARWPVRRDEPWFLHWLDLPAGALDGAGPYAAMTVGVEAAADGMPPPRVGLGQFDFAPIGVPMSAFSSGLYEIEPGSDGDRAWRWSADRIDFQVHAGAMGARLTLAGESTRRNFERASMVTVRVGDWVAARFDAGEDFVESIVLPADRLQASPALVTIETDQVFVPFERGESADRRRLGLRLYRIEIAPVP